MRKLTPVLTILITGFAVYKTLQVGWFLLEEIGRELSKSYKVFVSVIVSQALAWSFPIDVVNPYVSGMAIAFVAGATQTTMRLLYLAGTASMASATRPRRR